MFSEAIVEVRPAFSFGHVPKQKFLQGKNQSVISAFFGFGLTVASFQQLMQSTLNDGCNSAFTFRGKVMDCKQKIGW